MDTFRSSIGYPNVLAMVLAGGEGSRLYPLTKERAKPSVPFGGKYRIIDFTLSNLVNSGIFKIKVLTQFKSNALIKHLSTGWNLSGVLGQYIDPVPAQMMTGKRWYEGTADAIFQNINLIEDENPEYVAVFAGDHIYNMDIAQMLLFHRSTGAVATISVIPKPLKEAAGKYGVIKIDSNRRVIGFREKPKKPPSIPGRPDMALVSMGNYIFNKDILIKELYKDNANKKSSHDFGRNIIPNIYSNYPVYIYDYSENRVPGESVIQNKYWEDVGTIDAYYKANMCLKDVIPEINLYNESWPIRTAPHQTAPAKFVFSGEGKEKRIGVALDSIVPGDCIISGGKVIRSVLSRRVRIHSFAMVEDSIIFSDVEIGSKAQVKKAIIDNYVCIEPGDTIGFDLEKDRKRFFVTDLGVVIVSRPSREYNQNR